MIQILEQPGTMALGWTLIHSTWIAMVIAIIARIIWQFIPQRKAILRYQIGLVTMLGVLAGSAWTFISYFSHYKALAKANIDVSGGFTINPELFNFDQLGEASSTSAFSFQQLTNQLETVFPILVLVWLLGTLIMGFRLIGGWWYLNRLSKQGLQIPEEKYLTLFSDLCTKMGIRQPVRFLLSNRIAEPITLRHLKPIVLLPIGLLTQLSPQQVEVILLHELAHVKRYDYLFNWLQSVLELLFFYHPAVWWLSAQVREAREHCCDDLVLQAGQQQRMLYAQTLTQVSAYSLNSKFKLAMSLNGNKNSFTFRVKRMFGQAEQSINWRRSMVSGILTLFLILVFIFNAPAIFAERQETKALESIEAPTLETPNSDLGALDTVPVVTGVKNIERKDKTELEFSTKTKAVWKQDAPELKVLLETKMKGALVQLNGRTIQGAELEKVKNIPPDQIETINVMGGNSAIKAYGDGAKNGVVLITTKKLSDVSMGSSQPKLKLKSTLEEAGGPSPLYEVDGKIVDPKSDPMSTLDPDEIATINVLKGEAAKTLYGERGVNGVVQIRTKKETGLASHMDVGEDFESTRFLIGEANNMTEVDPLLVINEKKSGRKSEMGNKLNLEDVETMRFRGPQGMTLQQYGADAKQGVLEITLKGFKGNDATKEPLIVLDGKVLGKGKELIDEIGKENIATVNVIKGEKATSKYGSEASNGVVVIVSKDYAAKNQTEVDETKQPLVVLDGKVLGKGKELIDDIDPEKIESVSVLKGEKATGKYGAEAADGVVEIISKDSAAKKGTKIVIRGEKKGDPLFVVDGVRMDKKKGKKVTQDLDPNDISSINVLKGKSAISIYGKEGADGVIEITTKAQAKVAEKVLSNIDKKRDRKMDNRMVYVNGKKRGLWKDVKTTINKEDILTFNMVGKSVAKGPYKGSKYDLILITLKSKVAEPKKSTGSVELEFPAKTTIIDMSEPKDEPVSVDNLKVKMTDFGANSDKEPSHVQIKTDGGVNIKALLSKTEKQPLFILNGKRVAANDTQLQTLDSKSIVTIDLIENGPGLIEYGEAAQYGALIIRTKQNTEPETTQEAPKTAFPSSAALETQKKIETSLTVNPNPYSETIQVNFSLPEAARTRVSIYDLNGKELKVLADAKMDAGLQRFNWNANQVPAGNYLLVLDTQGVRITKSIVKK